MSCIIQYEQQACSLQFCREGFVVQQLMGYPSAHVSISSHATGRGEKAALYWGMYSE